MIFEIKIMHYVSLLLFAEQALETNLRKIKPLCIIVNTLGEGEEGTSFSMIP